jgi:hypothetical protein
MSGVIDRLNIKRAKAPKNLVIDFDTFRDARCVSQQSMFHRHIAIVHMMFYV